MIFMRIKSRVVAQVGDRLLLRDVADVWADARYRLADTRVALPLRAGVWTIEALPLILMIQDKLPDEVVNLLGDGKGFLYRKAAIAAKPRLLGRTAALLLTVACFCATLLLGVGGALAFAAGAALGALWLRLRARREKALWQPEKATGAGKKTAGAPHGASWREL